MQNILFIIKAPFIVLIGSVVIIGSIINGSIDANNVSNKLDIEISNVKVDGEDITESAVSENVITFTTGELQKRGDYSVLEYELTNKSSYNANVSMYCIKSGKKSDYFIIEDVTPNFIKANDKEKASLTVTLVKESLTDSEENFYCTLDFNTVSN